MSGEEFFASIAKLFSPSVFLPISKYFTGGRSCRLPVFIQNTQMALKATIYKADLQVADMDRNHYQDYSLTLARHPSETDERLMVRLLAFALYAEEALAFGKGLSSDDEPDLWQKDLTGVIDLWISVGLPDERWVRKAAGRARRVVVLAYGDRVADVWWEQNSGTLKRLQNLSVLRLDAATVATLGAMARRNMAVQCTVQDGEALFSSDNDSLRIEPEILLRAQGA